MVACENIRSALRRWGRFAGRKRPQRRRAWRNGCFRRLVAWRFCLAQYWARGFSALGRLFYFAHKTKTAMLRRLFFPHLDYEQSPIFPQGSERAKRECAWKSPHARKGDTRLRFARSTILEEKWGTVFVVYPPLPSAEITCSRSPWLKRKTRDCSQFTVHPDQQSFCRTGVAKRWIDTGYFSPACIVSPGTVPLY